MPRSLWMSIARFTTLAALSFALISLSGGGVAQAVTKKQCSDKFLACNKRCEQRASDKYPKDIEKQLAERSIL